MQHGTTVKSINYMFRPLLGHHQFVLSLQSNYYINSASNGRRGLVYSGLLHELN